MSKRSKNRARDTWLYVAASATGAALLCMILTSWATSTRLTGGIAGVGIALIALSHWRRKIRREHVLKETVVDVATVLVDAESRAEILFGPAAPVMNPKLVMSAHGRPVVVEDAWHEGAVLHWRHGVVYPGVVDSKKTLKILLYNQGFTPAMVHAQLVATEERQ
jgi:hypothetical protein